MSKVEKAELFAKGHHQGNTGDKTLYSAHLEAVVNRLKSIGISDEAVLCAGWLHDTLEYTDVTFDDLLEQFGKETAVLVYSISQNTELARKEREKFYIKHLKSSPLEAKLIKLCDISATLGELKESKLSKTKKLRKIKQKRHYFIVIKNDLISNKEKFPKIQNFADGINQVLIRYRQRPVTF